MSAHGRASGRLVARNTVLNVVGQAVPLLVGLAALPLLVRALGSDRFGALALAWTIFGYSRVLGFGRAATWAVAERLGREETERLGTVVWVTLAVQLALGLAIGGALALLAEPLASRFFQIPAALVAQMRSMLLLLAIGVPIALAGSSLQGVLEGAHRFDYVNAVRAPTTAANFLVPLGCALAGWSLSGIVAALLVVQLFASSAYAVLIARTLPRAWRFSRPTSSELRGLARFGSWVTVSSIVSPGLVYLDRLLLGVLVSVAAVGFYAAPYELVTRLWIIPASLVGALFPAFSEMAGRAEWRAAERMAVKALQLVLLTLGPVVTFLAVAAPALLRLWLGADFALRSGAALQILAVGVLINSMAQVPYALLQGAGRADLTARFHLSEVPVQLIVAWLLIRQWGITGAAVSWTLRVSLDAVLLFAAAARIRGHPLPLGSLTGLLRGLVVALALGAAALTISVVGSLSLTWLRPAAASAAALASLMALWRLALDAPSRVAVIEMVARALPVRGRSA